MQGVLLAVLWVACGAAQAHYTFFRSLERREGRRVFGDAEERAAEWHGVCALLDQELRVRCSCAVLAPRWAVTAAHCATRALAYVQYDSRDPYGTHLAAVYMRYAHPDYRVIEKIRGVGREVVVLRNDVGLVRTREDMRLRGAVRDGGAGVPPPLEPLDADRADDGFLEAIDGLWLYDVHELCGKEIEVLGYSMTDLKPPGERLQDVRLQLVACAQEGWSNCACAQGNASEVCAGDSGGPVLYNSVLVGVTSLGPLECAAAEAPAHAVRSVFTALLPYAAIINSTINSAPLMFRMRVVAAALRTRAALASLGPPLLLLTRML